MRNVYLAIMLSGIPGAQTVTVGTAAAAPGQRATGVIAVPVGTDASLDIPVIVINVYTGEHPAIVEEDL